MKEKGKFIITIDTEGDNLWNPVCVRSGMREITVKNSEYLERFQLLCEKYKFIPTYLVDYEMAKAGAFVEMAKEGIRRHNIEIGMHMHAWNCPPIVNLPYRRHCYNPYAGDYSRKVIKEKVHYLTGFLEDIFQCPIIAHRGGRWYLDEYYISLLKNEGYLVDCSITPGISWKNHDGYSVKGCDYSRFPHSYYELDSVKMGLKNGKHLTGILEVPMTIMNKYTFSRDTINMKCIKKTIWLRPERNNLSDLMWLVNKKKGEEYIEFMLHSSELMPGGSPTFRTEKSIEKLYQDLESLFCLVSKYFSGSSLSGFAKEKLR